MKQTQISLLLAGALLFTPVTVFADAKDDRIAELEAQVAELQAMIDELKAQPENVASTSQDEYALGESWIVEGQWKLTIDSVEEMSERNEYSDTDPAAVYLISYTYENLGYESDLMDGLHIDFYSGIVDAAGKMGYTYPNAVVNYPQETPVGATCEAQSCIGVDNAGSFKIHFSTFDGNMDEQNAVFSIEVP